ncbi:MAG: ATP-binding cassette domain-containing protein [Pirellulaceae bacterium]|nr:ATP-binding cassette domain-containing protein [Pirellulaceae bacterium]
MIQIQDLEFRYPHDAFRLRVPELTILRGETVALVGPSGSGKTTLLNLVAGISLPRSGSVRTGGVALATLGPAGRRRFRIRHLGLVFQEFELLDYLNVLDNILLPCRITGTIRLGAAHRARAIQLAEQLGISDKLRRPVRRLSQGERQRVAVCRALLLEPPLLLCDEPTGNLDPANKRHVLDLLFDYVHHSGTTLLTVTHDVELLPRFERSIDIREFLQQGPDNR